ncbi:MAG: RHS repeat domain-containing protein [Mucilaginibacter sp.]
MKNFLTLLVLCCTCAGAMAQKSFEGEVDYWLHFISRRADVTAEQMSDYAGPTQIYYTKGANYRYGFNGKENDNEVKGEGKQQDYGMRIYDPRVGRFLSVDPIAQHFPWNTPYSFAENKVIEGVDFDGLEVMIVNKNNDATIYNVRIQNTSKEEINVYAHGTQRGMGNNEQGSDHVWLNTTDQFDKYMTKVSDQWRNRKNDGSTVLVLHSCRTGRAIVNDKGEVRGLSIGQKISKQFNITVVAPDERDNFGKDGEIGPLVDEDQDINGSHPDGGHHKSTNIQGNWNVFKDGKLIESYRGGWTPKAKATWWDKLIYGRDIKKIPQPEVKVPDTPSSVVNDNGKGSDKKD